MNFISTKNIKNTGDFGVVKGELYYVHDSAVYKYPSVKIINIEDFWAFDLEIMYLMYLQVEVLIRFIHIMEKLSVKSTIQTYIICYQIMI